ncbi:hypothetical protein GQ54DRAFT_24910 [Martensiomyces pterosporus]|nr:hypothetical protein GQ54DRAFT_24910 [Martensiomyces pterosporus]
MVGGIDFVNGLARAEIKEEEVHTTPLTTVDRVILGIQLAVVLSNFPAVIYLVWNRNYPPIKAKQVWITAALGCSIVPLSLSTSVVDGATTQTGVFKDCHSWATWGLMFFGLGPVFSLANYRLVSYYRVFVAHKLYSFRRRRNWKEFVKCYWPLAVFFSPALVSCIVTQILPEDMAAALRIYNDTPTCLFRMNYAFWLAAYLFAQIFVSWVLYFLMRGIAKSFNEFKTVLPSLLILTCSLAAYTTVVGLGGMAYVWGRSLSALTFSVVLNSYFWLIVAKPIFGHMFWRDRCLRDFLQAMHEDGLTAARADIPGVRKELYGMDGSSSTPNHTGTLISMTSRLNRQPSFSDSIGGESAPGFSALQQLPGSIHRPPHSDALAFSSMQSDVELQQEAIRRSYQIDEPHRVKFEQSPTSHIL